MRKLYQNEELFSFLGGVIISLACTVLYEGISNINNYSVWKLMYLLATVVLMIVSTTALITLSNESKNLILRFDRIKGKEDNSKNLDFDAWTKELWDRAFRSKVDEEYNAKTGEELEDGSAARLIKKLKRKLDWLFWSSVIFFLLAMSILVVVQFIC